MNKQGPGKIGWCDYTWNPIKGLCPVGCWYCYGRAMYRRFKRDPKVWFDQENPFWRKKVPEGSKIFVCSTFEIFHPVVKKAWRDEIFYYIKDHPQHTFQVLTKLPENIDRPMPDNVWLGLTITGEKDLHKIVYLDEAKAGIKFVSFEPLFDLPNLRKARIEFEALNWVILGRLTGHGKKHDPPIWLLENIVEAAQDSNIPIFLKDNLKDIWKEDLIQSFPKT